MTVETADIFSAVEDLIEAIKADYRAYQTRYSAGVAGRSEEVQAEVNNWMIENFEKGMSYNVGKKYIKIVKEGSVWGFVVNTQNDKKFQYGDILKAAGWATPARNKARGNVFDLENAGFSWTGPTYLN